MSSFLIAVLCCAAISYTITTTSIFEWLRDLISRIHPKLEEWIHCPWCFNHYVVAAYLLIMEPLEWVNIIFYFGIIGGGGIVHYFLLKGYEIIAKSEVQRKINNLLK